MVQLFSKNSQQLKSFTCFRKKVPSCSMMLDKLLNTPLIHLEQRKLPNLQSMWKKQENCPDSFSPWFPYCNFQQFGSFITCLNQVVAYRQQFPENWFPHPLFNNNSYSILATHILITFTTLLFHMNFYLVFFFNCRYNFNISTFTKQINFVKRTNIIEWLCTNINVFH